MIHERKSWFSKFNLLLNVADHKNIVRWTDQDELMHYMFLTNVIYSYIIMCHDFRWNAGRRGRGLYIWPYNVEGRLWQEEELNDFAALCYNKKP
jgi:hypothetical protein